MQPLTEGLTPQPEQEPSLTTYITQVNFRADAVLPPGTDQSDTHLVILFGFDTRDEKEPVVITPFPLGKTDIHEQLNDDVTNLLRPELAKLLDSPEDNLRFPSLYDLGQYLSPYMRHEIGYSLLMLGEKQESDAGSPKRLREALRNTGNIFLMSTGVRWHMNSMDEIKLEQTYHYYFEQMWDSAPNTPHESIRGTDLWLKTMEQRGRTEIKMTQDWPDIADLGHGLEYMMMRTAKKGGSFEMVAVGGGIPPNYGTPIGASYMALRIA